MKSVEFWLVFSWWVTTIRLVAHFEGLSADKGLLIDLFINELQKRFSCFFSVRFDLSLRENSLTRPNTSCSLLHSPTCQNRCDSTVSMFWLVATGACVKQSIIKCERTGSKLRWSNNNANLFRATLDLVGKTDNLNFPGKKEPKASKLWLKRQLVQDERKTHQKWIQTQHCHRTTCTIGTIYRCPAAMNPTPWASYTNNQPKLSKGRD